MRRCVALLAISARTPHAGVTDDWEAKRRLDNISTRTPHAG